MNLTKSEVKTAVAMASSIAQQKSTLPILNHILFTASNGVLKVLGSNTDIQVTASAVIADTAAAFNIAIPADRFSKIIGTLDDGANIKLEHDGTKLTVKSGRSKSSFATLPANEFPVIYTEGDAVRVTLAQDAFKSALSIASKSAAVKDVRYYLNGICLESDGKRLHMIATDGHRATVIDMGECDATFSLLISTAAVQQLVKLLNTGTVDMEIYGEKIAFVGDDWNLTTKPIAGKFPDWRRVVPTMTGGASADRATLLACIQRGAVAVTMPRGVSCEVKDKVLTITGGKAGDESSDSVDLDLPDVEFGANVDYLIDAVTSFDEVFNIACNGKQVWLWHDNVRIVVMAMRI